MHFNDSSLILVLRLAGILSIPKSRPHSFADTHANVNIVAKDVLLEPQPNLEYPLLPDPQDATQPVSKPHLHMHRLQASSHLLVIHHLCPYPGIPGMSHGGCLRSPPQFTYLWKTTQGLEPAKRLHLTERLTLVPSSPKELHQVCP